jgi:hypothetical protein
VNVGASVLVLVACAPALGLAQQPADPLQAVVRPFLARHCTGCHSGPDAEGGLALDGFGDAAKARAALPAWTKVRERLLAGEMPPPDEPRPPAEAAERVVDWIDRTFFRLPDGSVDPGRPTLRRLNRAQYENAIRDLFGVEVDARAELPSDDVGHGFDSVGDVLSTSDVLFEKYVRVAERVASAAVVDREAARAAVRRWEGSELDAGRGGDRKGRRGSFYTSSVAKKSFELPRKGAYLVRVRAWGDQAGPEPARMAVRIDNFEHRRFDVAAVRDAPQDYDLHVELDGGPHALGVAFLNDYYAPDASDPGERDRNLHVDWVEIEGPLDAPIVPAFQRRWLSDPAADRRAVIAAIAHRTWRRPVREEELDRLVALASADAPTTAAVRQAIVALLVSPNFLFRVEDDAAKPARGGVRALDDWELATRLAFFLWSSTPDDELLAACGRGLATDDEVLGVQVERLLRDPRASALARDFAPQWLQIRALERHAPDPQRFPGFDERLRASMQGETELFFDAVLREGRSVTELLLADFTFLDEGLARHYGVLGVRGDQLQRVRLEPGERNGLLGQGSILTVTSNPTRTSPVKRGKWVLEVLLGAPPPPPPPGVGDLNESADAVRAASLRGRMEQHRKDPSCAACHARLDPLGFGLENFDPTGAWRTLDGGFEVDATGTWPDGTAFRGPAELREQIARDPRFVRALTRALLVYALGRGLTPADDPCVDAILAPHTKRPPALRELVLGVVRSDAFRKRRVQP